MSLAGFKATIPILSPIVNKVSFIIRQEKKWLFSIRLELLLAMIEGRRLQSFVYTMNTNDNKNGYLKTQFTVCFSPSVNLHLVPKIDKKV